MSQPCTETYMQRESMKNIFTLKLFKKWHISINLYFYLWYNATSDQILTNQQGDKQAQGLILLRAIVKFLESD